MGIEIGSQRVKLPWYSAAAVVLIASLSWPLQNENSIVNPTLGLASSTMFRTHKAQPFKPANSSPLSVSWTYRGGAVMNPVVVQGIVYGGTVTNPYLVVAINATTGHVLWTTPVNNQVMTKPLVINGRVFVGTGNSLFPSVPVPGHSAIRGTMASSLMALSAKTGQVLWQDNTVGENMPTPLYRNGQLYAVGGSDNLLDVNAETGRILRTMPIGSYVSMASPALSGHMIYFGGAYPYDFYAINLNKWTIAWKTHFPTVSGALDDCPPLVVGQNIYTETVNNPSSGNLASVVDINKSTGKVIWQKPLGTGPLPYSASGRASNESGIPTYHMGVLYLGSPITKSLYALNAHTGRIIWKDALNHQPITQAPLFYHDQILIGNGQGTLWTINAKTGQVLNQSSEGGSFMPSELQRLGHTLIFGTKAPSLTAIPLTSVAGSSPHP